MGGVGERVSAKSRAINGLDQEPPDNIRTVVGRFPED